MSRTRSFDRITLYRRICMRAGITPAKATLGYFTKQQMKDLALYMDRIAELFDRVDSKVDAAMKLVGVKHE